jgi:hypothetical protein
MLTRPPSWSGTDHVAVEIHSNLRYAFRGRADIPACLFEAEQPVKLPPPQSFYFGKNRPKRLLQKVTGAGRLLLVNHNLRQDHHVGKVDCCLKNLLEV